MDKARNYLEQEKGYIKPIESKKPEELVDYLCDMEIGFKISDAEYLVANELRVFFGAQSIFLTNRRNEEEIKKLEETMKELLQSVNNYILSEEIYRVRILERENEEIWNKVVQLMISERFVQDKFERLKRRRKIHIGIKLEA
ncbi:MAG: hypothetical protein Ta2E_10340 [Mycoplasmoidaceae bacterium]|nr:MAG: hypothetical protein Ta2E_10340 [Mycoplasmoidaceae bacterium]